MAEICRECCMRAQGEAVEAKDKSEKKGDHGS
jgi:hypothetical protein